MWIVIGAAVWLGVFDYITKRSHTEYLYLNAAVRLGIPPLPGKPADLRETLAEGRRHGAIQATVWAVIITGAGLLTIRLLRPNHQIIKSQVTK